MPTSHVQIVLSEDVNGTHRLFGGRLMEWIDVTAAVEARRHAKSDVTLAAVDALEFISPVEINDTVVLMARITWTGQTSMEVRVDTFVEHVSGVQKRVNRAYLVFVAIDRNGHPRTVQPFKPGTEDEAYEWRQAIERRQRRLDQREALKERM